jgi:hypothetical protein
MEQILTENAQAYAAKHQLQLAERPGLGIYGIIFAAVGNVKAETRAVKVQNLRKYRILLAGARRVTCRNQ